RNLTDEQIKAIAKNGGVIQVNFGSQLLDSTHMSRRCVFDQAHKTEIDSLIKAKMGIRIGSYLHQKYPEETDALRPSLSRLFEHIDHLVKLVGADYVGLGSDFDGIANPPHDLEDVSKFPNITKGLVERGYSKRDIKKILGGNFLRVFKANMKGREGRSNHR
ncbi:MAG: membrane dipeptidase, partial [Chitinophagaceae bacterium]|nr:membrane dipeptidase [Chitinophagaceae bacterium]